MGHGTCNVLGMAESLRVGVGFDIIPLAGFASIQGRLQEHYRGDRCTPGHEQRDQQLMKDRAPGERR